MTERGVVWGGRGALGLRLWKVLVVEQNPLFGSITALLLLLMVVCSSAFFAI